MNEPFSFNIPDTETKDVFCVSASSGSIERVFSTATDILYAKRKRMKPDLFQSLMFIKRNANE